MPRLGRFIYVKVHESHLAAIDDRIGSHLLGKRGTGRRLLRRVELEGEDAVEEVGDDDVAAGEIGVMAPDAGEMGKAFQDHAGGDLESELIRKIVEAARNRS